MAEIERAGSDTDTVDVSARKKALLLGKSLGLTSEGDYRPSTASVAERALHRQQRQMNLHQANLESIYTLALNYTPSDVTGVELDADWSYQFFQMAEQIHNRRMQDLWARILASEIVNPGNFSLRSLAILRQLTLREAQILERALGMSVKFNQETKFKLLSGYRISGGIKQYFRKNTFTSLGLSQFGLPYSNILTLIDAGIIHRSEFETGLLEHKTAIELSIHHEKLNITPQSPHLLFTYYRLTPVGDELSQLVSAKGDVNFTRALKTTLAQDFIVE